MRHHLIKTDEPVRGGDLKALLQECFSTCPEIDFACLVGRDGLSIASAFSEEKAPGGVIGKEALDAEAAALGAVTGFLRLSNLERDAGVGALEEWSLRGSERLVVLRPVVAGNLFLVLGAKVSAWSGQLRFAARVAAGRIQQSL